MIALLLLVLAGIELLITGASQATNATSCAATTCHELQENATSLTSEVGLLNKLVPALQNELAALSAKVAAMGHNSTPPSPPAPHPATSGSLLAVGTIVMWAGKLTALPKGFSLCNGLAGTPDLSDKFVLGAGGRFPAGSSQAETPPPPPLKGGAFGLSKFVHVARLLYYAHWLFVHADCLVN